MEQLRWLAERGIEIHTQLVIVPEFNDGPWLERSISELSSLWPAVQSVSVVPVGLTRHHKYGMRTHTAAEAGAMLDYISSLQPKQQALFGTRFLYPSDEWFLVAGVPIPSKEYYEAIELHENGLGMVRRFLDDWQQVEHEITSTAKTWRNQTSAEGSAAFNHLTLVTGTLFATVLTRIGAKFASLTGIEVNVLPVVNARLGDQITVAGLLMGGDVLSALARQPCGDLIVLPRIMFDHPDTIALDDISPQDVANSVNKTVVLADGMGDVWDALVGQARLIFRPLDPPSSPISLRVIPSDQGDDAHIS